MAAVGGTDGLSKAQERLVAALGKLHEAEEADPVDELRVAKAEHRVAKAELGVAKAELKAAPQEEKATAELGVAKAELGVAKAELKAAPQEEKATAELGVAKAELGVAKAELKAAAPEDKANAELGVAKAELGVAKAELKAAAPEEKANAELGVAKAELGVAKAELKAAAPEDKANAELGVAKAELGVAKAELKAAAPEEKANAELGVAKAELGIAVSKWEAAPNEGRDRLWALVKSAQAAVDALRTAAPPYDLGESLRRLEQRQQEGQERLEMAVGVLTRALPSVTLAEPLSLTPSDATTARRKKDCLELLAILKLESLPIATGDRMYTSDLDCIKFNFCWEEMESEEKAYGALKDHLLRGGRIDNVHVVGSGTNLPYGNLFDVQIHELRSKLGVHGEQVMFKATLRGRPDLVSCEKSRPASGGKILTWMVDFAIEVKTQSAMQKNKDSCELEAMLQVIGLNSGNSYKAPPVVLTNLVGIHSVLYLERTACEPLTFEIRKQSCISVLGACAFASELCKLDNRRGIAKDFGRGPTPVASFCSFHDLDEGDSQDLDNFAEVMSPQHSQ